MLLPGLEDVAEPTLPTAADLAPTIPSASDVSRAAASSGPVVASYEVRASDLDQIQEFLYRGRQKQALKFALDRRMWGHAFLIASAIDKESWQEAVSDFLKAELSAADGSDSNGRESLRVAYRMFSGQGHAAGKITFTESHHPCR
jgi:hypothetical protein